MPHKTARYHRQVDQLAQFTAEQAGLIISALPQSLPVERNRYQKFARQWIGAQIVLEHSRENRSQSPEVAVL
jgi:hypothetical protein